MFSKGSNTSSSSSSSSAKDEARAAPAREPAEQRPSVAGGGAPSIISADLTIVGNLTSKGDVQIDGTIQGDISSRSLTIGEAAVVEGTLMAEAVRVYGTVRGEIQADAVTLARSANVEGNVLHKSLTMESGAVLTGRVGQLTSDRKAGQASAAASSGSGAASAGEG